MLPNTASGSGAEQLFDLVEDPGELHDLAAAPEAAGRVRRWRERLVDALADRPEGFVTGSGLTPGLPVDPVLPWSREASTAGQEPGGLVLGDPFDPEGLRVVEVPVQAAPHPQSGPSSADPPSRAAVTAVRAGHRGRASATLWFFDMKQRGDVP